MTNINSILDLEGRLQNLKRVRDDFYTAKCPVHGDTNSSLGINIHKNKSIYFYCFAGCTHEQVCDAINTSTFITSEQPIKKKKTANWQEACRWLEDNWNKFSLKPEHKDYLIKREIDYEMFSLVSSDYILENLPSEEKCELYAFAFSGVPVKALQKDRIVIPYFRDGRIVSIRSRFFGEAPKGVNVKYAGPPSWPGRFYTPGPKGKFMIVTEGEFKAMSCVQSGISAGAVPGIMSCHEEAVEYCKHVDKVVWFDSEIAGKASRLAARKLAGKLGCGVFELTPYELSPGYNKMDIDEAVKLLGPSVIQLCRGAK